MTSTETFTYITLSNSPFFHENLVLVVGSDSVTVSAALETVHVQNSHINVNAYATFEIQGTDLEEFFGDNIWFDENLRADFTTEREYAAAASKAIDSGIESYPYSSCSYIGACDVETLVASLTAGRPIPRY